MLQDWKERWKARSRRVRRKIELLRLKRIRQKKTPKYSHCKNCGTPLEGMYCYRCGQYALDAEQPFWKYVRQYFENVYQFDTKIWRTLWYLFTRPGFLTAEFNAGKINSYVHPFRLYMCISVVFFAVFFMLVGERANDFNALDDGRLRRSIVKQLRTPAAGADTTIYLYQAPRLVKTLKLRFDMEEADSLVRYQPIDNPYGLSRTTLHVDSTYMQTAEGRDSLVLRPQRVWLWTDEVKKDAETDELQKQLFVNDIVGGLSKWTPFYMMFLLPLFAALLNLFYRRKQMPYMWHFVHAIHLNTVFLILICIPLVPLFAYGLDDLMAAGQTLNTAQLNSLRITLIGFPVAMFLYLLMSFRTVYRQGWDKTTLKAVLFYVLFTAIASLLATALLLWLLATEAEAI